jgi:hypothetical protein
MDPDKNVVYKDQTHYPFKYRRILFALSSTESLVLSITKAGANGGS